MTFDSENLYLGRAKLVMKIFGIWVPPENEGFIRKSYRMFTVYSQFLFLIFQIIFIIQLWGDWEALSQASYLLFTQACLCFKVTVLLVNMDMLEDLLKRMVSETFQPQSKTHEKLVYWWNCWWKDAMGILSFHATRIKRFLLTFMIASQVTCGMWVLKPFFDDDGSRKFPFDMWMPVTPDRSPQYQLGYAFQLVTIFVSAYLYFGVDSVALSSVIFGCAQLDIVKDKILSIRSVGKKVGQELADTLDKNYNKLIECIKQYQAVVEFTELVENAYHTYLLFQLMGCVGLFCMSALKILTLDWRSVQFFSIITYVFGMLTQLFACCWCGHELTSKSEELHTMMYHCIWYEQSLKFKRAIVLTLIRMRRPLIFKAGHYIPLLMETFVAILRMSYSYFAVLNSTT